MTPDVTFKAWHDGKIKVAAVTFRENYAAGCHCLFQFSEQAPCDRLKVTIYLYRFGHGVIFDPITILRLCLTRPCKIVQLWSYIPLHYTHNTTYLFNNNNNNNNNNVRSMFIWCCHHDL